MFNVINKVLFYTKIVLLLVAFSFVLYISFMRMDFLSSNILSVIPFFIPFFLLLVLFVIGFAFNKGNSNFYYNLVCVLALSAIIIISLRTMFDKNIIQYGTNINFNFFNNQEVKIKLLLYLMIICNLFIVFKDRKMSITKISN